MPHSIVSLVVIWALLIPVVAPARCGGEPGPRAAAARPRPESPLAAAATVLREAPSFLAAQIGPAGATPEEVTAWQTLLRAEGGDSTFKALLGDATPAGRLYALAGLYYTDPATFRAALPRFRAQAAPVWTGVGCFVSERPVGELADEIASGSWPGEFRAGRLGADR